MSLFDELGDLFKRVKTGSAPEGEVNEAYDRVAGAVPSESLADGLSHAFKSDETPPFEQMVSALFDRSTPEQRADFVNHLISVIGPAGVANALSTAGIGGESPTIAPEMLQGLARQAAAKDPSIIDKAARFYSQHPTLVKSLGVAALAVLMRRVTTPR
jgi:hypothetical protein